MSVPYGTSSKKDFSSSSDKCESYASGGLVLFPNRSIMISYSFALFSCFMLKLQSR